MKKNKKHVPLITLMIIISFFIGVVVGYTLNVDKQVEKELNIRLERIVDDAY